VATEAEWATFSEYPWSGYPTKSGTRWWGEVPVRSDTICAHPDTLNRDTLQAAQLQRGYAVLWNYKFDANGRFTWLIISPTR
jgi:hypothetical protein